MLQSKDELEQDVQDLLRIAKDFAPVERCPECDRYTKEGYICIHCGYDGDDGEDLDE